MKLSTFKYFTFSILLLILGGVVGFRLAKGEVRLPFISANSIQHLPLTNTEKPDSKESVDFSEFWHVWNLLEQNYLDEEKLKTQDMVHGAIQGMTAAIGDPYTVYLPPAEDKRFAEDLQGSFYGVGIQLGYIKGTLAVIAPLKGMPAEAAGVQAGDLILHVKDAEKGLDEDTTNFTLPEAVNKIRGKKGKPITLTLLRESDENTTPFEVTINRDEIIVPSVEVEFVEHNGKKAAHLQLFRFGERTEQEWNEAVRSIQNNPDVDGVVLDMRNNPGGLLDGAVDVSSEFIANGEVVTQKGKITNKPYRVNGRGKLIDTPVIVLVNKGSASASEIVAGALRDRLDAKLVGENTFGKGTVQDRMELPNGGGLHITIARWLLPDGGWIHEEGLKADVEVKDNPETEEDEVVLKAIEELGE